MPGVGGQFRSLAIIRSKDVDLGREIGGGPPGAKFDLTEVLPVQAARPLQAKWPLPPGRARSPGRTS